MGSGIWSTDVHSAAAHYRAATGASAFGHNDSGARTTHPRLDPWGVTVRESRDSVEHPESLAIAVLLDVTGSMRHVPRALQQRLPRLLGLLVDGGYVAHPQIMFGAVGDATCDRAPLQVGQFESDNRLDDDLGRLLLEGGGGGQLTESYELAMYFMARHTAIDCHEKRGRRGYLFLIGDELTYPTVSAAQVASLIGGGPGEDIPTKAIVAELTRRFDTYLILPEQACHAGDQRVLEHWRDLLGQNVLRLDDLDAVCETIALTIGLAEDAVDLADGLRHVAESGSSAGSSVSRALGGLARGRRAVGALPPGRSHSGRGARPGGADDGPGDRR